MRQDPDSAQRLQPLQESSASLARSVVDRLLSLVFLVWASLSSLGFFVGACLVWAATVAFDKKLVGLHLYSCFWASMYLWTNPAWSVTMRGREKIRRGQRYVIVSNHQSLLDILLAFRLFVPFKWVAKAETFSIPLIGWNMRLNRYIKLRRGDPDSIQRMFDAAERALSQGNSVYLFPEGTRSTSGALGRFKTGAFVLAKKMRVPILPVAIQGTRDALPKKSLLMHGRRRLCITVLNPIPYEAFATHSAEAIAERVRERIALELSGGAAPADHCF